MRNAPPLPPSPPLTAPVPEVAGRPSDELPQLPLRRPTLVAAVIAVVILLVIMGIAVWS